jgi:hypothetical protein
MAEEGLERVREDLRPRAGPGGPDLRAGDDNVVGAPDDDENDDEAGLRSPCLACVTHCARRC